jgi:hypothetical protein
MHDIIKKLDFINHQFSTYCMYSTDKIELRRVQGLQGERSFTLVFPKEFATELGVGKGDFLKCQIDGNRLIVEKLNP